MANITPVIKQYLEIKARYPDTILFFRLGDFYEMFFEDAQVASQALEITLTTRDKGKKDAIPLCGVPYHKASYYIGKLVEQGFKVAVCDQMEEAEDARGIVKREVTRVVTPGLIVDPEVLEAKDNNFLLSLSVRERRYGISCLDLSTGEFRVTEVEDLDTLKDELERIKAKEVILPKSLEEQPFLKKILPMLEGRLVNYLEDGKFEYRNCFELLTGHFNTVSLDGFGCQGLREGIEASGAILSYLKDTQKGELSHINRLLPYKCHDYMIVDEATKRNLEIFQTQQGVVRSGSLLALLDQAMTAMGGRRLRSWLNYPLRDLKEIQNRLEAVGVLQQKAQIRRELRELLGKVYDLERLNSRIVVGSANARDLVALRISLQMIPGIKVLLRGLDTQFLKIEGLDEFSEVVSLLENAMVEAPPLGLREGGLIKEGYDARLDELRAIRRDGKGWIARMEEKERTRTGIGTLKVGFNKVFGYYLEVTRSHLSRVPPDYIRKQTLTGAERFITPELKEYETKVLEAEEEIEELEYKIFCRIRRDVAEESSRIQQAADHLAQLDVIAALAEVASRNNYIKPEVEEGEEIRIEDGRHPVLEQINQLERFVPNDTYLNCTDNMLLIITGPNMAGKSTIIRQTALIVLMAQIGSFVPAKIARVGLVDRIFTRVGASDNLIRGQSTFLVEMSESANILHHATKDSLIILDEIGRGTSTFDGISIAWAVAEFIHDRIGAKTLFATHYHELVELALTKPGVKNFNIAVKEWNDRIIFLRKLVEGGSSHSYGIQVARLAGLPPEVLDRAKEIMANLENEELDEVGMPRLALSKKKVRERGTFQLQLFNPKPDVVWEELERIDPTTLTPLEALNKLNELKELSKKTKKQ
ncbi:MAG: DNA mismatch repair protein MutS [Deltaproteobacteria bacterium]|nr:MAG: DNA mismatch repair protein MutS [Deltaproteobacteria bacterium]